MIQRNRNGLLKNQTNNNNNTMRTGRSLSLSRQSPLVWLLVCFLCSVVSFYGGMFIGWHTGKNTASSDEESGSSNLRTPEVASLRDRLKDAATQIGELKTRERKLKQKLNTFNNNSKNNQSPIQQGSSPHHSELFDEKHTGKLVSGMGFVDRNDFAAVFDTGVPLDETTSGNDKVLILYSDPSAFPETEKGDGLLLSAEEATSNCLNLHLVLTHNRKQQCIAVMGQYESFHIYKYMRAEGEKGSVNASIPLAYVSRGHQQNGRISSKIPKIEETKQSWENLVSYFQNLDNALDQLKPLLENVASHNDNNAVIVLVCNFGQSELLLNCTCVWFLCCILHCDSFDAACTVV